MAVPGQAGVAMLGKRMGGDGGVMTWVGRQCDGTPLRG